MKKSRWEIPLALPPRLKAEEEEALYQALRRTDRELRKIGHSPAKKNSRNIRDRLYRLRKRRRELEHRLVLGNLRLAVSIAQKKAWPGDSPENLSQAGFLGMLQAAERYDARKGVKFGSYATWFILNRTIRGRWEEGKWISVPLVDALRIRRFIHDFRKAHDRLPKPEEIAKTLHMHQETVLDHLRVLSGPVLIDQPLSDEKDSEKIGSTIPHPTAPDPEEMVGQKLLQEKIQKIIRSVLDPREARILYLHKGEDLTFREIGPLIGVSRQRAFQIFQEAKQKVMPHLAHLL